MDSMPASTEFQGLQALDRYDSSADRGREILGISRNTGQEFAGRPIEVEGPMGMKLTMASLPSPDTRRWVVRRKAEVLAAINGGLLTAAEACARYRLSPEELELWQASIDRAGVPGLRVTRIQLYRDYPAPRTPQSAARTGATPANAQHSIGASWSS